MNHNFTKKKMDRSGYVSGFTLVETLVTLAIFSTLFLVLAAFQRDLWVQNAFIQNGLAAESEARGALKDIIAEIRSAAQGNDGSYAIVLASSTAITFFSDVNQDGDREKVRYFIQGTNLMRGVTKPSGTASAYLPADEKFSTVVHNLVTATTSVFSYYSGLYDGSASSSPLQFPIDITLVRMVGVSIAVEADPARAPNTMVFESRITVRNLKDNL